MNPAASEPVPPSDSQTDGPPPWSRTRWIGYLLLAFGAHLGLIYALGNRKPVPLRPVKNNMTVAVAETRNPFLELADPTVFAGPHPRGFAASTWLHGPKIEFPTFRWTEPARLLSLATDSLGTLFLSHRGSNVTVLRDIVIATQPPPSVLPPPDPPPGPKQSYLHLSSNLAARNLVNPPAPLPLQRAQDGLTNTVVRVLVDAAGRPFSPTLVPPGSNSREADQLALQIARGLKFAPDATAGLTVGTLVFEWQGEPATNSVPR